MARMATGAVMLQFRKLTVMACVFCTAKMPIAPRKMRRMAAWTYRIVGPRVSGTFDGPDYTAVGRLRTRVGRWDGPASLSAVAERLNTEHREAHGTRAEGP